ncbi:MAG: 2-oxoglutarate dehydrogenase, E2 component, dihydrolipoamide succinyltransferase [Planctomycetes bacterium]|nr:2-oxoglutarate dehydrogenase, E2 component, dihydrolipoamide succinyltransferase [Planctomycetota bacterium]
MPTEIRMPQMGESIAEGTLTRWFKKPGDHVKRDEPLFEISTDKVDAEVPAPADGVLTEILVDEGTTVEVNSVVGYFGDAGDAPAPKPVEEKKAEPEPKAAAPAPEAAPTAAQATAGSSTQVSRSTTATSGTKKVRSSPLVRRIARENGIDDLSVIPGSGVDGRVTKTDILSFVENRGSAPAPGAAPASPQAPAPKSAAAHHEALPQLNLPRNNVIVEPLSTMRRKIAEHMIESRRTSAHVHSVFEADMTKIVGIRQRHKKSFEERHGTKLTFMPFFIKAVTDAIREFPWVNASLDGNEILVHRSVNMGIAVALEGGLIVPVIRNADELNLVGIQRRTTDLASRARSKQLVPDEVTGGTFTITNPGQYGGLFGIPIISQPQVAILGIGGIQRRPVVVNGDSIAIRDMAYLCLGYDHRLVDGAYADQFMAKVKTNLENFDGDLL